MFNQVFNKCLKNFLKKNLNKKKKKKKGFFYDLALGKRGYFFFLNFSLFLPPLNSFKNPPPLVFKLFLCLKKGQQRGQFLKRLLYFFFSFFISKKKKNFLFLNFFFPINIMVFFWVGKNLFGGGRVFGLNFFFWGGGKKKEKNFFFFYPPFLGAKKLLLLDGS